MRIAVHASDQLAVRTSRVLLAESGVHVGLFGEESPRARVHIVDDLADWDVLVVDEVTIGARVQIDRAIALRVPVVLATEAPTFDGGAATIVEGVLEGPRLGMALAESGIDRKDELMGVQLGWTVPGHQLPAGVGVTFPSPIGALWADTRPVPPADYPISGLAAPTNESWRGVTARLTLGTGDGVNRQTLGIADDRKFMNGILLASAAMAAAEGAYPTGLSGPGDADGVFLRNAQRSGLDIASFTPA